MSDSSLPRSPPVFTIRLWQEQIDTEHVEWRGEVKNIASGEIRYFRDWQSLAQLLPRMLHSQECGDLSDLDQEVDSPRLDGLD